MSALYGFRPTMSPAPSATMLITRLSHNRLFILIRPLRRKCFAIIIMKIPSAVNTIADHAAVSAAASCYQGCVLTCLAMFAKLILSNYHNKQSNTESFIGFRSVKESTGQVRDKTHSLLCSRKDKSLGDVIGYLSGFLISINKE